MPHIDGPALRAWRRAQGWDVPEMARQLRRAARDLGQTVAAHDGLIRMIYAWERGDHSLSERYELLAARAFGVSPEDLAAGNADAGVSSLLSVTDGKDGDDPVDRREFGLAAIGALAASVAFPSARTVSAGHVRGLQRIAADMWTRDRQVGGSALLKEARICYQAARALLDDGSYSSAVGRSLQAVTAELAACAGFIAFDAADQAAARHLLIESALIAGGTGDALLVANSLSLLAMQSTSLAGSTGRTGLAREALRFLDQASQAARHEPSPKAHAIIAMRKATASALLGDEAAVKTSIAAAYRELDRGDHPSDPHWAGFVTPAEVTGHEALSWINLGDAGKSAGVLRVVLEDPDLPSRNRTYYRALLSSTLEASGDRPGAVNEALAVLPDLEGQVRSARSLNLLRPLRERVPLGSELAARFDAVASAS